MAKSAIETYVGFCVKARKIALGQGTIDRLHSGVYAVLVCSSASQNTFKLAVKYSNRHACPLIICKSGLENAVNKPNCKIAAVQDKSLAEAIVSAVGNDYEYYAGGNQ